MEKLVTTTMANMIHNVTGMDHMMLNATMVHNGTTMSGGMHGGQDHGGTTTMDSGMGGHGGHGGHTTRMGGHGGHGGHTTTMDHGAHGGGHGGGHEMLMYFHTGYDEYILFEELRMYMVEHLIIACFVMGTIAVIYEGLKVFREYLFRKSLAQSISSHSYAEKTIPDSKDMSNGTYDLGSTSFYVQPPARRFNGYHFLQAFLHMIQVFISYCLMLIFMTFNVWLCLSVVLGAGIGYLLFGWMKGSIQDKNEHCH